MTEVADTVPICCELLGLVRIDPAVIRLVVRICAGHQFHICTVRIGKRLAVPFVAVIHWSPGPELAALVDVVVGRQHCSGILAVVVTADEIVFQVIDEY